MNTSVVLVTGASAGIGLSCVHRFLASGAAVIGWSRRPVTVPEPLSQRFIHQSVDVRNKAQIEAAVADLANRSGADGISWQHVDVLVNNAGLSRGLAPLHEGAEQDWEEMIDTNIKGLLYVTRTVLPAMVERGQGMIVNIASVAGRQPYYGGNVYGATKAAVKLLSESLQIDLLGTGVRVCNIDPGMVETEFSLVRHRGNVERAAKVYQGLSPLTPDDVADAVLYCATRPKHVTVQDMLLMPTDQASIYHVHRK